MYRTTPEVYLLSKLLICRFYEPKTVKSHAEITNYNIITTKLQIVGSYVSQLSKSHLLFGGASNTLIAPPNT